MFIDLQNDGETETHQVTVSQQLADRLPVFLSGFPKLEKLSLIIPAEHTALLKTSFENDGVPLKAVRTLVLSPFTDWIIGFCPSAEIISTHDWRWQRVGSGSGVAVGSHSLDFIAAAGQAQKLQHFEIIERASPHLLNMLFVAMPDLQSLAVTGGICSDSNFADLVPLYARFRNLKLLALAGASQLIVGSTRQSCGKPARGLEGMVLSKEAKASEHQILLDIGCWVFTACVELETLWISDFYKLTTERSSTGAVTDVKVEKCHRRGPTGDVK